MRKHPIKNLFLTLIPLFIFCFLQSCSVQKRKYNKGFYVSHKHRPDKVKANEKSSEVLLCSAKPELVVIENKTVLEENNSAFEGQKKSSKKLFPNKINPKQIISNTFKKAPKSNVLPSDKNNSKYKVSIFQINVMGLVSVCLIPLMIISFFIPGAALLVWCTLIAGVLLAFIAGFMIQKRPGAWMAGLAMGLWGLILLYFVLILFVF